MAKTTVTISTFHDTRRKKIGNTYPVKLRVYFNYERRYYPTGYDLSKEDFASTKPRGKLKEDKEKIDAIEAKAKLIKDGLKIFSFERFEKKFLIPTGAGSNIFWRYQQAIDNMRNDDRINTATSYECSMKSLKHFLEYKKRDQAVLPLDDITVDFLREFQKWMINEKKTETTVGIYLRPLRAIFNQAIMEKEVAYEFYPFSVKDKDGKYRIPIGNNVKKALNREDLKKLLFYETDNEFLNKARAFWFFSYFTNGMNLTDIAKLKRGNIEGNAVSFIRSKTKNTAKKKIIIKAVLTPFAKLVVEKYGNTKAIGKDDYLFTIIDKAMNEEQRVRSIKLFVRYVNQHMLTLAKLAGVNENVSTYAARHSFASHSITVGNASMEYVMESLGHGNMVTTQNYFSGFGQNVREEVANKLIEF